MISAMSETPASVIEALIAFFAVWSVLGLAGFHSYLAGTNQTTNEEVTEFWCTNLFDSNFIFMTLIP